MHEQRIIHFVRHGENPANLKRQLSYKMIDYPLTEKGRLQARRTAEFFKTKGIGAIYSSPLKRAEETARIIAEMLHQDIILLDEFRELDVGRLEDDPASNENWKIHDEILENWKSGHQSRKFPGGESFASVTNRIKVGVRQVLCETSVTNNVVVTHGGLINSSIARVCHIPPDLELSNFDNCTIITVLFDRQMYYLGHLQEWAYSGHLYNCPEFNKKCFP